MVSLIKAKVTVVGAGNVGATAALFLAQKGIEELCLIDVAEGLPQGKALDLMHMRSIEQFPGIVTGTNDYADTAHSDLVVVTAGVPRKPGMTRDDLLEINSSILKSVVEQALEHSPNAIFLIVTNPLDVMTYLAMKVSGLDSSRVIGMGGVLDSARFVHALSELSAAHPQDIEAWAIGAHGDAMTPMAALSSIKGRPLSELLTAQDIEASVARTIQGGAEVVSHLKTGSAFYAPAASIVKMAIALLTNSDEVLPVCAYLQGQYGINDVYLSVPARLGSKGLKEIVELELDEVDVARLQESANATIAQLAKQGLRSDVN